MTWDAASRVYHAPDRMALVAVFAGIGALFAVRSSRIICVPFCRPLNVDILQVEKDVRESHWVGSKKKKEKEKKSHDALVALLVDLFQRLQFILKRLGVYTLITREDGILGEKIVGRVISILSIVTKDMHQSRGSRLFLR